MELNTIYCQDCLEGLQKLKDKSIDCIIIDPPYNISYSSNYGTKEYKSKIQKTDWDKNFDFSLYFKELFRVLKNDSFMYVFGRFENFETMKKLGVKRILIWDKQDNGMGNLKDWGIGYEIIYLFKKGKPFIKGKRENGVIQCNKHSYWERIKHPTQKPLKLIKYIISKSSNRNDIILDCFIGSGTTAVACKELGRNFIGFEKEQEYVDIANTRLKKIQVQKPFKEWFK